MTGRKYFSVCVFLLFLWRNSLSFKKVVVTMNVFSMVHLEYRIACYNIEYSMALCAGEKALCSEKMVWNIQKIILPLIRKLHGALENSIVK